MCGRAHKHIWDKLGLIQTAGTEHFAFKRMDVSPLSHTPGCLAVDNNLYLLCNLFLLNFNLNFISSVSLGSGHCYINEPSQKSGKGEKRRRRRENEKKCSLSLGCPFCHPISYASGLCLCGEGEGEQKGDGRLGPINNQWFIGTFIE